VPVASPEGTVTDSSGALMPGVAVTVLNLDTGAAKDLLTNSDGLYDTASILPGNYRVTFTTEGFGKLVRGPITLQVGTITVNGALKVGKITETVEVTADVPRRQRPSRRRLQPLFCGIRTVVSPHYSPHKPPNASKRSLVYTLKLGESRLLAKHRHYSGAADKAVNLVGCKSPHHQLPGQVVSISDACGGNEACSART
jgi:hypothetical protein